MRWEGWLGWISWESGGIYSKTMVKPDPFALSFQRSNSLIFQDHEVEQGVSGLRRRGGSGRDWRSRCNWRCTCCRGDCWSG